MLWPFGTHSALVRPSWDHQAVSIKRLRTELAGDHRRWSIFAGVTDPKEIWKEGEVGRSSSRMVLAKIEKRRECCGREWSLSAGMLRTGGTDQLSYTQANTCTYVCARILEVVNFAAIVAIISEKAGRSEEILKALRKVSDFQKRSDLVSNHVFTLISVFNKIIDRIFGRSPKSS